VPAVARNEETGCGLSGGVEVPSCFACKLSIFGCLVFIACPLQRAPDAISNLHRGSIVWLSATQFFKIRQVTPDVAWRGGMERL
jgi:hypothetical protein